MNSYEIEELLKQPYNGDDVNPVKTQDKRPPWNSNQYYEALIPMLKDYEKFRPTTYTPTLGDKKTIGFGHTGKYAVPGGVIDESKGEELLRQDAEARTNVIRSQIPEFDSLPFEIATQLGQSAYRGGITGSPKTIKHINMGEFQKAAKEFLDNDEYRNAEARGRSGIRKRMEAVSEALSKPGTGVTPAANMKPGTL
jgi:GH24 family phage-related lysozyme (muramidase)